MTHCGTNMWGYIRLCIGFSFIIPLGLIPFYYADIFFNPEIPSWELPEFPPIGIIEISLFCGFVFFVWWGFRIICWPWGFARTGKWEHVGQSPVYVVHGALLKSRKVLMFAGAYEGAGHPLDSAVWDPEKQGQPDEFDIQEEGQPGTYTDDLFCSHHSCLADGKLLVNGGDNPDGHTQKATYVFDPDTNQWIKLNDMEHARWYPTTITLPEGKGAITFSGNKTIIGPPRQTVVVDEVETFDSQNNTWTTLPNTANKNLEIYPGMHLLSNGKILYVTTRWDGGSGHWNAPQTALFDLNSNSWSDVGYQKVRDRTEGMSVILPPDNKRVLVMGGRGDDSTKTSTDSVEMIDFNEDVPEWKEVQKMHFPRRNVNAVLLPTGKVLVCAGIQGFKSGSNPEHVLTAELYDPETDNWKKMAPMTAPRQYHSVSLLLPDARVLNLGSVKGQPGPWHELRKDMEIYSPPYLYCGNSLAKRPKIVSIPKLMHHKQTYTLETPDARCIDKVVLVKPGAVTHHTGTEQRVVPVKILSSSQYELQITMPSGTSPNYEAIRGYYMIFIINKKGVPSKAEFIELH